MVPWQTGNFGAFLGVFLKKALVKKQKTFHKYKIENV